MAGSTTTAIKRPPPEPPVKILTLTNLYPPHHIGGYELRCRDITERLAARGHQIRILTSDHHLPDRGPETTALPIFREFKVHGMYGHPWLPIHQLHAQEKHNHLTLLRHLEEYRPEIVHLWNMGGISKSLLHRLEALDIPVVYDVSDHWIARSLKADVWLDWWNTPGSASRRILRGLATATGLRQRLDALTPTAPPQQLEFPRIYFCSAYMRDHTASKGWPVEHASVIHCGIDTAAFALREKPADAPFTKLLWVGRISEDKDPYTAVRALHEARKQDPSLQLDLYGHGTDEDVARLDSLIAELGLKNDARRTSASADEMRALYAKYDALLFTSNWGEPFALTPLEASAAGLPVVSSLDGGQRELVRDGENMIRADAGEPKSFAAGIVRLAADPGLRARLAATAREECLRRFDLEPITSEIEDFLRDSLPS